MLIELKDTTIKLEKRTLMTNVNFHVDKSEFVYIIGKVGSGKSSLLKTLYGENPIHEGTAKILNYDLCHLKRKHIPELRRNLGIVFQDFQLLSDRTIYDNLEFVLKATLWKKKSERDKRITEVLCEVGLEDKADSFPHELSGGEQQRAAIARALLNSPKIIIADEPTGNLDHETSKTIIKLLRDASEHGSAVIIVTHNLNLLQQYPGIVYRCEDGTITDVTTEYNKPITIEN